MPILIKDIQLKHLNINKTEDGFKCEGSYQLISSADTVLATQEFNGYSNTKIEFSPQTHQALKQALQGINSDIQTLLGIKGGE